MTDDELRGVLHELETRYRGYMGSRWDLVSAEVDFAHRLVGEDAERLRDLLVRLATDQYDPAGIELDVLIEWAPPGAAMQLAARVRQGGMEPELEREVVLALLRLGHHAPDLGYEDRIAKGLRKRTEYARTQLAAFCHVSPDRAVTMAAEYFAKALRRKRRRKELYPPEVDIPMFVIHYLDVDKGLVPRLVDQTLKRNAAAGRILAQEVLADLSHNWDIPGHGAEKCERASKEIARVLQEQTG